MGDLPMALNLPNPLTPMAFIPPELAREVTIGSYIFVAVLGILIWEMLNNVSTEWELIKRGFSLPLVVYFLARFSTLAFTMAITLMETAPIGDCNKGGLALRILYPIQVGSTALLFFMRVRAMYRDNKWVIAVFFVLWLGVSGASATAFYPFINLGPTDYCVAASLPKIITTIGFLSLSNDSLVFLATTWRLAVIGSWDTSSSRLTWVRWSRTAFLGKYLPSFSKAMLRDGQVYYLVVVVLVVVYMILFYVRFVPEAIVGSLGIPISATVNIMACRVYRNTKLGVYQEPSTTSVSLPSIQWARSRGVASQPQAVVLRPTEPQIQGSDDNMEVSHQAEKIEEDLPRD